jgi:hypothetical protein
MRGTKENRGKWETAHSCNITPKLRDFGKSGLVQKKREVIRKERSRNKSKTWIHNRQNQDRGSGKGTNAQKLKLKS